MRRVLWVALVEVALCDGTIRLATSDGDFAEGGHTWTGSRAISVEIGSDGERTLWPVARVAVEGIADRSCFLRPPGNPAATVRVLASEDGGASWTTERTVSGVLARPVLDGGVYDFEVRPRPPRGRRRTWSHEDRARRFPGDRGMAGLRAIQLAGGRVGTWPE